MERRWRTRRLSSAEGSDSISEVEVMYMNLRRFRSIILKAGPSMLEEPEGCGD